MVLAISQSGETADTLAAMEEGRKKGAMLWSNRERDRLAGHAHRRRVYLHAGRTGDRRGLHQSLYRAVDGPVHAGRATWATCGARLTQTSATRWSMT